MKFSLVFLIFICATTLAAKVKKCRKEKTGPKVDPKMNAEVLMDFEEARDLYIDMKNLEAEIMRQAGVFQKAVIHEVDGLMTDMLNDMLAESKGAILGSFKGLKKFKKMMPKDFEEEMVDLFSYLRNEVNRITLHSSAKVMAKEVEKGLVAAMIEGMIEESMEQLVESMGEVLMKEFGLKGHESQEEVNRIIEKKLFGKLKHASKKELEGVANRMIKKHESVGEALVHEFKSEIPHNLKAKGKK